MKDSHFIQPDFTDNFLNYLVGVTFSGIFVIYGFELLTVWSTKPTLKFMTRRSI